MIWVTGAYGRRYFGPEDAKEDWEAGKDFRMVNETYTYINKSDWKKQARMDMIYFQHVTPSGEPFAFIIQDSIC
mgnify:FL=1